MTARCRTGSAHTRGHSRCRSSAGSSAESRDVSGTSSHGCSRFHILRRLDTRAFASIPSHLPIRPIRGHATYASSNVFSNVFSNVVCNRSFAPVGEAVSR